MHSPQILDTLFGILINLNATPGAFSTGTWTKKDGIYRDYSIVTPDAFSTGIAQRKMVSILYRDCSIVTPDAFFTGIGQRMMVSIAIKSISLLMHSQHGLHKERWYL